jgi:hypothetical protein
MASDRAVGAAFGVAPQVRFLNFTCVTPDPISGCAVGYTATLTSTLGEKHTWSSFSVVPSPYQTVLSTFLNGFTVFLGAPFSSHAPIVFSGSDFVLTPGHKYTIRFDVNNPTTCSAFTFCLFLFDTTNSTSGNGISSGAGIMLRQAPIPSALRPSSVEPAPGPTAPGP